MNFWFRHRVYPLHNYISKLNLHCKSNIREDIDIICNLHDTPPQKILNSFSFSFSFYHKNYKLLWWMWTHSIKILSQCMSFHLLWNLYNSRENYCYQCIFCYSSALVVSIALRQVNVEPCKKEFLNRRETRFQACFWRLFL